MGTTKFYHIAYYRSGKNSPITDYIDSKNDAEKAKIAFYIDLLEEKGLKLKRPYCAYMRDKIWELRPEAGMEKSRLFYFFKGKLIVFVHAVDKKDFKQKDISLAVNRMMELI
jgi:hypothetical protein